MSPAAGNAATRADGKAIVDAASRFLESFPRPAKLLVAVSGGSDSTGLLLALSAALKSGQNPGFSLVACTIDHGLRRESADEALVVSALCERHGIPHSIRRWSEPKPATGLQAAAREKRYELLAGTARDVSATAVLTGHTADDQRETVTMRTARGEDGVGLSGMAPAVLFDRSVWVMRPFLGVSRDDIRAFLDVRGEGWIDDPSNANPAFERVRVRNTKARPAGDPGAAALERERLSQEAARLLGAHVKVTAGAVAAIEPADIARLAGDVAGWRALMLLVAVLGGRLYPPEQAMGARIRAFLESGKLSRMTAGRVVFDRRKDGLYLYREHRGITGVTIPAGGSVVFDSRYDICNRSAATIAVEPAGRGKALSDGTRISGLPDGVAARAGKAFPVISAPEGDLSGGDRAKIDIASRLAPYDRFLPSFDLTLANALAGLFAREDYPPPPNA